MPFEFQRRARLFLMAFGHDSEIRYPETRLRLALELRSQLLSADRTLFQNLLDRFARAKKKVSILDLPLLIEWSERKNLAQSLIMINQSLEALPTALTPAAQICRVRLIEIASEIRRAVPDADPKLTELLSLRWRFAALRDEAQYLIDRLRSLR